MQPDIRETPTDLNPPAPGISSFDTKGFVFTLKVAFTIVTLFYAARLGVYGATKVIAWKQKGDTPLPAKMVAFKEKLRIIKAPSPVAPSPVAPSPTPLPSSAPTVVATIGNPEGTVLATSPAISVPIPSPSQNRQEPVQSNAVAPTVSLPSIAKVPNVDISGIVARSNKSILANLDTMTVDLFMDGTKVKSLPIASKGRPGSHWETPSGIYEVLTKERTHFSSIGEVNMPYSMQFYGNFFIHGWPTYKDGTPVAANYSGGCIRLKTADAAQIYAFADRHTPLIVVDKSSARSLATATLTGSMAGDTTGTTINETPESVELRKSILQNVGSLPKVSAGSFLVADLQSGEIIASANADTKAPIASVTKLMTAIVSNEVVRYDAPVKVTAEALATYGDSGGLVLGEKINATDMLYPLLMESSNDAAEALARHYGRQTFIEQMNKKAAAIGMVHTAYKDPAGILPDNTSTPFDLFTLAQYLYEKKQFLLSITRTPSRNLKTAAVAHAFRNFNVFSSDPAFLGGKTGYTTAAKETMVSIFEIPTILGPRPVAIIVLGSKDRAKDVSSLLSWTRTATASNNTALQDSTAAAAGAAIISHPGEQGSN